MRILTVGKTDAGFTLIELVVVVLLIMISIGLVASVNFSQRDSLRLKSTGRQLYSFLQAARSQAILQRQVNRCWYVVGQGRVNSDLRAQSLNFSPGVELWPGSNAQDEKIFLAHFYPDGSAAAANFCIKSGSDFITIQIDPLLGFVSMDSGCLSHAAEP